MKFASVASAFPPHSYDQPAVTACLERIWADRPEIVRRLRSLHANCGVERRHFVLPIERWARGGMQREVAATLNDGAACRAVGLAPDAVARLWKAFDSGAPGIYWSRIWSIFALLRWCDRHRVSLTGGPEIGSSRIAL